jgi:hypothetical protein
VSNVAGALTGLSVGLFDQTEIAANFQVGGIKAVRHWCLQATEKQ